MPSSNDEIVISGLGGLYPKVLHLEAFEKLLFNKEDHLESRWPEGERGVSNKIGCMPNIEHFDAAFFGIHRTQVTYMDPMHRLILERTFEALCDAGVNPLEIRGKKIGVYMGSSIGENDNLFYESIASGFGVTGHSRAMMANRISYWLNLRGPSCAYDSNWLNGFDVIQLAYNAIKEGQIEGAIVGTANLNLNSEISWLYNDLNLLSPDGITRSFDEKANGYGRSDGVVVLYIQKASTAKRNYCTIVNVLSEYNGYRDGPYLRYHTPGMVDFMNKFYEKCGVDPSEVEYLEAYGCALPNVDEAEITAVEQVFCKNRKDPLKIGCVKSNIGHAEASAGLIAVSKAIIAMESGYIPGNKFYDTPNPKLTGLVNGKMEVVTEKTKYNGGLMAVNGLGISSSNGHILLRPNRKNKKETVDTLPKLFVVSTRTEEGIKSLLNDIQTQAVLDPEYVALTHKFFSKAISGHLYRGYCVLDKEGEAKQEHEYIPGNKRPIWFVYSGMGSQWNGMGRDLMQLPIFAESIHKCAAILKEKDVDLLQILTTEDKTIFDNILHSFVGIAAVQIALTNVLRALGIVPDGIIGHSVGELGCAYADECFTDEQMILCSYSRGKASLEATLIRGMMAAIGLGYNQIKDMLPPSIEVACHNGPDSSTISGPTEDMEKFVKELQDKGIFARLVNVSNIAYHSRYIKPAAPSLLKYLQEVVTKPNERSAKWISTSVPENMWETDAAKYCSAEYHTNNLLGSVLFEEGSRHIPKDSIVIEIAPHGLLQAILKRSLKPGCTNIPLTNRASKNGIQFLLGAIGKMYLAGIDLDPSKIYPTVEFPVSRSTKSLAPLVHWEHGEVWRTGLEEKMNFFISVREVPVSLNTPEFRECVGHQLDEKIVLPISSILNMVTEILKSTGVKDINDIVFQNLRFHNYVTIPKIGSVPLYVMIQKGTGKFEILSGDEIITSGSLIIPNAGENVLLKIDEIPINEECAQLTGNDIYSELSHRGHNYGGKFKSIKLINLNENGSVCNVSWYNDWSILIDTMLQQYLFHKGEKYQKTIMPTSISRIAISLSTLPKEEIKEMDITYNFATGIISGEGIRISGVNSNFLPNDKKPYAFDSIEFVPFKNAKLENVDNMMNYCFNLTLENFDDPFSTNIQIAEVETANPSFKNNIRNVLSKYCNLLANVSTVKESNIGTIVSQSDPLLVVMNGYINDDLAKLLINSHAFALCRTDDKISKYTEIVEFSHFVIDNVQYSLIRKAATWVPNVVKIKGDVLSSKDITRGSTWVTELQTAIANSIDKKVYLVSNVLPTEGIVNFVRDLRSNIDFVSVRSVFILDKKLPEFRLNNNHYAKLAKQDSFMVVYKEGLVGSYIFTSVDFKENVKEASKNSNLIKDTNVEYIGINLLDETKTTKPNQKNELGNVDYGGTTKNGENIIGLANFNYDTFEFVMDPILKWTVPISMSLQNAVTIPHAYATAYHCLVQRARLEAGDTVLIHAGCTAIGMACISIATSMHCNVFTTVANDKQKSFLLRNYHSLIERNILNSQNSSFEPHLLLATGGVGAHVIVNFLSDDLLQASTRCLADSGRLLQIGKLDLKENNSIGMRIFLKNTAFICVLPEDLFNWPEESKRELQKLVADGIENFVVRPLRKEIVSDQNIEGLLGKLKNDDHIGKIIVKLSEKLSLNQIINQSMKHICEAKGSYLVYGGTGDIWSDMTEWLILRGARKIIITSDSMSRNNYINRRLSLLQTYFQAEIIFAPNRTSTKDGASELLNEVIALGQLQAVYLLPNKNNTYKASELKSLQYIDMALRNLSPKALIINFVNQAAGLFQTRSDSGFPTYNIQWQSTLDFHNALSVLDYILNMTSRNIFIKDENVSDSEQETKQVLYKKLTLILPHSLEDLKGQVRKATTNPEFVQLTSQGPRTTRELPPIFIIPGLSNFDIIKDMSRELLHPVFCAKLPITKYSIKKLSEILAEKMTEIFPDGPYNLLGISCGGPLAIEISRILQKRAKTQITFIDGAPDTIQAAFNYLGEGIQSELNFLTKILNINNNDIVKALQALPNWNSRVTYAIDHSNGTDDEKVSLKEMILTMKEHVSNIVEYKPSNELITAEVSLIKPLGSSKHDNCGLPKYCKESIDIQIINGDHISMMRNKDISDIINDKVIIL